jgi:hypothetical protein
MSAWACGRLRLTARRLEYRFLRFVKAQVTRPGWIRFPAEPADSAVKYPPVLD